MAKRLFEVLDEMNIHDAEHKSAFVSVSNSFVSTRTVKQGNLVEMGVPTSEAARIMLGDVIPILLLIDKKEYDKRK